MIYKTYLKFHINIINIDCYSKLFFPLAIIDNVEFGDFSFLRCYLE